MDIIAHIFFSWLLLLLSTAAAEDLSGWFDVSQPDTNLAASCESLSAAGGSYPVSPTTSNVQSVDILPPGQCRGVTKCAAQCLRDRQCYAFTFDDRQMVCKAFTNTSSDVPCIVEGNFWRKQLCGLRSTIRANITTCASRLLAPLPDSAFTATSERSGRGPMCAKLYNASANCTGFNGAWVPATTTDSSDFMQIDMPVSTTITGYDIKARLEGPGYTYSQWVKSFSISYSCDGQTFNSYSYDDTPTVFQGNNDGNNTFSFAFDYVIAGTRSIRIQPIGYNVHKSMRIELYGC